MTTLELAAPMDRSLSLVVKDFVSLTKPRLSGLVLFTTFGGMWLAGQPLSLAQWVFTLLATAGTVASANAFNCWLERDSDRLMARTATRPLPTGRMHPNAALAFAVVTAVVSLPTLLVWSNPLTAALGLLALASYVLAYTPLKRRTHLAMLVGALPGALPPLMGWTAATGTIELPGVLLFAVLFVWQLPHFIAIALFRKEEYRAAGLTSVPLAKGDVAARWEAFAWVALLLPLSVLPWWVGVAGPIYLAGALALGGFFFAQSLLGAVTHLGAPWARRLFATSLLHLTGLFIALGFDGGR